MLLVHFLASATPVPSWRLLLSAGIERPHYFWARNESVVADDLSQSAERDPAQTSNAGLRLPCMHVSHVFLFFSIPTCSTGLMWLHVTAGGLDCWVSILCLRLSSG